MAILNLLFGAALLVAQVAADCHEDNCYRALFPCASPSALVTASSFCATVTAGSTTATNFPLRATSACGTAAPRYVSACACGGPSCACPGPVPPGTIYREDFECGLDGWNSQVIDPYVTTAGVGSSPPPHTGVRAYEVHQLGYQGNTDQGVSARVSSPVVPVRVGQQYRLTYWTYFDGPDAGFIGTRLNGVPLKTTDARDLGYGAWHENTLDFNATASNVVIMFEFLFNRGVPAVDGVDTISLKEL